MNEILYGGDAQELKQLERGDVITPELLYEACSKVYDGKNKLKISFPNQLLKGFHQAEITKKSIIVTEEQSFLKRILSFCFKSKRHIVRFKTYDCKEMIIHNHISEDIPYFKTIVSCGLNELVIITTLE